MKTLKKKKKLRVGIIFGGKSAEHEISLQSARNIFQFMDREKYKIVLIFIDKKGRWYLNESPKNSSFTEFKKGKNILLNFSQEKPFEQIDVAFPVLHGPYGEDGTIQGLFKTANIPFVGTGVLGSAISMDKDITKRLLREAGIPIVKFLTLHRSLIKETSFKTVKDKIGLPFFIKPANTGSSIGINKVKKEEEFLASLKEAFQYDNKILLEEAIQGREIECSVLGNENPIASLPGEIIPRYEFYSYKAKYLDEKGAILKIPAELPANLTTQIQNLSLKVFKLLECKGMARVDFFLKNNQEIIVNELNTIPGFTRISMYPKLWEASGISYPQLIERLIQLAFERFKNEKRIKTSFSPQNP
ncbi:D-alanine--D-alanine ligase [Candidatus Aerophobetes bacterium]|nr:D-alanine--D-alanine ligase [Candidatus Aerophobetes bacterium]